MRLMTTVALAAALALSACNEGDMARVREDRTTRQNQANLLRETPLPSLERSLERANLVERLQRINQQNMAGCIYLISHGSVMAFYPVRGKVTSLNSYLTATHSEVGAELPDLDGAYGENVDGVFFFEANTNAYVEWRGEYLWSDQCLTIQQQPALTRQVR